MSHVRLVCMVRWSNCSFAWIARRINSMGSVSRVLKRRVIKTIEYIYSNSLKMRFVHAEQAGTRKQAMHARITCSSK